MASNGAFVYTNEEFEELLRSAKVTQQSIQQVSHWMLERRGYLTEMVDVWFQLVTQDDASHQIVYLYIANDTLQVGVRRFGHQIGELFQEKLVLAVHEIMSTGQEKVKRCLIKLVGIWKERNVLDPEVIELMERMCAGNLDPAQLENDKPEPVKEKQEPPQAVDLHTEAQKELDDAMKRFISEESIEQVLENQHHLDQESQLTKKTSSCLHDLVSATISSDLMSDRMFQLQSSLSVFQRATEAYESDRNENTPNANGANPAPIQWSLLDQQVFDLDIEKSHEHVQQFRENIEEQVAKREQLLKHLSELKELNLFNDKVYNEASRVQQQQEIQQLQQLYKLCHEAVHIERQRQEHKQQQLNRLMHDRQQQHHQPFHQHHQRPYHNRQDAYNGNGPHQRQAYGLERRHSSSGFYDDRHSKRARLNHSMSVDSQSPVMDAGRDATRWNPLPPPRRETPPPHGYYANQRNGGGGGGYPDRDRQREYHNNRDYERDAYRSPRSPRRHSGSRWDGPPPERRGGW